MDQHLGLRSPAQAELILADPTASVNDKVRIDGAARRARLDMQATLEGSKRRASDVLTLADVLRGQPA